MNYNDYEFRVENKEELKQLTTHFNNLGIELAHEDTLDLSFPMTTSVRYGIGYHCSKNGDWGEPGYEDDYHKAIPVYAVLNLTEYPEYFI